METKKLLSHSKKLLATHLATITALYMSVTVSAYDVKTATVNSAQIEVSTEATNALSETSSGLLPLVYSPEFPDAYILQNEPMEISASGSTTNTVSATVFVEEEYGFDDSGNPITISSRLLSESVLEIGLENFGDMENVRQDALSKLMQTRAATNARGSLAISFSGSYSLNGTSVTANLTGNASWSPDGLFWQSDGQNNPAPCSDYMGVTWSGGSHYKYVNL